MNVQLLSSWDYTCNLKCWFYSFYVCTGVVYIYNTLVGKLAIL